MKPAQLQTKPHAILPASGPAVIGGIGLVLIVVFIGWFLLVAGPVLMVETKYRIQKISREIFGTTDIARIFFPHLSLDLRGYQSQYTKDGITIPKIFVDEPVIYNVDPNNHTEYTKALKQGIAHASGTAFPDNGQLGYYFAHSSTPEFRNQFNAIFYLLGKLEPGDTVFLWHEGKRYEYAVAWTAETAPDNVDFLHATYERETIVLQTCWPPGTTNHRLLVFAERVPHSESEN